MHEYTKQDELIALIGVGDKPHFAAYSELVRAGKLGDIHSVLRQQWDHNQNRNTEMAKVISEIKSAIEQGYLSEIDSNEFMVFTQVLGKALAL